MLKATLVRASLLCALVPLASACAEAAPAANLPDGPTTFALQAAPLHAAPHASAAKGSAPASAHVFPRSATLFGESYEEWAAKWWQWVIAIPKDQNPNLDAPCDVDQSGKVFFLGGNFGGVSTRTCTAPAGKAIFFPILNVAVAACPEIAGGDYTCDTAMSVDNLHDTSTWLMNLDKTLTLEINGVAVEGLDAYRAHSDTFSTSVPESFDDRVWQTCAGPIGENECGAPVGSARDVVTDGYWIMLHPLPPGEHQIHLSGSVSISGQTVFSLDISYNLVVSP